MDNIVLLSFLTKTTITIGLVVILFDETYQFYSRRAAIVSDKLDKAGSIVTIPLFFGTAVFTFERITMVIC